MSKWSELVSTLQKSSQVHILDFMENKTKVYSMLLATGFLGSCLILTFIMKSFNNLATEGHLLRIINCLMWASINKE